MKRRSTEEWDALLAAYADRKGSKEAFCKHHGINSSSLSYQLERRSEKRHEKFSQARTEPAQISSEVVVELPSGVRLRISG